MPFPLRHVTDFRISVLKLATLSPILRPISIATWMAFCFPSSILEKLTEVDADFTHPWSMYFNTSADRSVVSLQLSFAIVSTHSIVYWDSLINGAMTMTPLPLTHPSRALSLHNAGQEMTDLIYSFIDISPHLSVSMLTMLTSQRSLKLAGGLR